MNKRSTRYYRRYNLLRRSATTERYSSSSSFYRYLQKTMCENQLQLFLRLNKLINDYKYHSMDNYDVVSKTAVRGIFTDVLAFMYKNEMTEYVRHISISCTIGAKKNIKFIATIKGKKIITVTHDKVVFVNDVISELTRQLTTKIANYEAQNNRD